MHVAEFHVIIKFFLLIILNQVLVKKGLFWPWENRKRSRFCNFIKHAQAVFDSNKRITHEYPECWYFTVSADRANSLFTPTLRWRPMINVFTRKERQLLEQVTIWVDSNPIYVASLNLHHRDASFSSKPFDKRVCGDILVRTLAVSAYNNSSNIHFNINYNFFARAKQQNSA